MGTIMILGSDFIILLTIRTGSLYARYTIKNDRLGTIEEYGPYTVHNGLSEIPKEVLRGKQIIAIVRDPFSWYLSLWSWFCNNNPNIIRLKKMYSIDSEYRYRIFQKYTTNSFNVDDFRNWLWLVLETELLNRPTVEYNNNFGFFTKEWVRTYDADFNGKVGNKTRYKQIKNNIDIWIKLENLDRELSSLFKTKLKVMVNKALNTFKKIKLNTAYTPELIELVRKKDGAVMQLFGYDK